MRGWGKGRYILGRLAVPKTEHLLPFRGGPYGERAMESTARAAVAKARERL
jgi:hypothetical protein